MSGVPVVRLRHWIDGSDRAGVAASVDEALRTVGFFLVVDHGVPEDLIVATRRVYTEFFHLPTDTKAAVKMPRLGMAGWAPMGMEANGYSFGHETPPDMKESYRLGSHVLPGRIAERGENVWPAAPAEFRSTVERYLVAVDELHLELLRVCAAALGLEDTEFFAARSLHNDNTLNVNWYAPIRHLGAPTPGQYRIGPHTDFGSITVLHREPGTSALEVQLPDGGWAEAPVVEGAFTVNAGDLLAHWSGGRWRSAIHRMLPPAADAVDETLLSLVYFCDPDPDTLVVPVQGDAEPVLAGDYLRAKIAAITMPDTAG